MIERRSAAVALLGVLAAASACTSSGALRGTPTPTTDAGLLGRGASSPEDATVAFVRALSAGDQKSVRALSALRQGCPTPPKQGFGAGVGPGERVTATAVRQGSLWNVRVRIGDDNSFSIDSLTAVRHGDRYYVC